MIPPETFSKVARHLYASLDCSESLKATMLFDSGEYDQLVSLTADPRNYEDPGRYYTAAQACDFLRKSPDLPTSFDRTKAAEDLFLESERSCARTNAFLANVNRGYLPDSLTLETANFLRRVRRRVSRILGPVPTQLGSCRHGPGSTFSDRAPLNTAPDKMCSTPTVTSNARCLLPVWGQTSWARALCVQSPQYSDPLTVRGNRFTVVSKDAKKGRGIAIEPSVNVYFQLGVGAVMRRRLRLFGFDLDRDQDLHRAVARIASMTGKIATIDLSSASDSVSLELVRACLPAAWFELLYTLRSPMTLFKGRWHHLSKFSSMGNGFTFELETLLFGAISFVVREYCRSGSTRDLIYGDDIIVDMDIAPPLVRVLNILGFTTNVRKTFLDSEFRESCGGDFFRGVDVRPILVEEFPRDPQEWITLHNGLNQIRLKLLGLGVGKPHLLLPALKLCQNEVPKPYRLFGPSRLGDLVFHTPPGMWKKSCWEKDGILWGRVVTPVFNTLSWQHWKPLTVLASALLGCPQEGVIPRVDGRDQVTGFRVGIASFS